MTNAQILIVEDEVIVAENIRAKLNGLGYAVSAAASSGEEAIQKATETHPDLVLMDIKLEGEMDGVEAAAQIHARFDIPVVYLTAHADDHTLQRAKLTEPFGYILKPFEVRELNTAIEIALYKHKVEKNLKKNEQWLATALRSIGDAVIATDTKGGVIFMNPIAEALTGWKQEEALGRDLAEIFNIIDEETNKVTEAPATKAIREGVVLGLANHALIARNGAEIPIDDRTAPIIDDTGNISGAVLIFHDIIERKRAEQALRESSRQLESRQRFITSILDSIPTSLSVIDRALRVVSVNRNFLEKTRREEQATLGRKIEEVFPQVLLGYTQLDQKVRDVFRTGQPVEGGKLSYRAPGLPTRIYYYRLIPLKTGETVENVMLLMDDITEREQLGEEVRRTERHLASVVECANDLVVSMDPGGRILTWNRAAEQTSGLRLEELKGQYLSNLCSEEERQKMGSWLAQLAKGQFTKKSMEINLRTKGGEEVPIAWAGSRMLDDEHRIVGLVAVGRDLTERKRLEAQLIQSAKLTSLGVMAGGIAHEIRNPLAISSAAAQLLLERSNDEGFREEAAEKIYSGIQRASYIIENLLKFARPPEERLVAVDIGEALEETLSLLTNQLRVQRVELRKDFASDLPLVMGNKSLLQQVFSNMILNACNAMPDGGSLTITTKMGSGNKLEIEFADTGVGVPTEHMSKIFDPFFTTMPVGKGIGLGLSISYSIIQQHQGTIEVESEVGKGTTFTVRLPVEEG